MRIETARAPVPSQPELVMSDGKSLPFFHVLLKNVYRKQNPQSLLAFYEMSVFVFGFLSQLKSLFLSFSFDGFVQL